MSLELKKRIITSIFLLFLLSFMFYYSFVLIISLIIISIVIWLEFYFLIIKIFKKKNLKEKVLRFLAKVISLLYLFFVIFLIFIHFDQKIHIFFILLIAIFSDIGGLVVGKTFKGKKLTKISPNKTISGSFGSLVFSLMLIPIFYSQLTIFNFYSIILYTFLVSVASQLGDLFISLLKRKAKVKNSSDLLPGHGGFLDRFDGIIFAVPIGILLLNFF
ncbi:phosphatidate cytidylyltransferase [Candidatus Pelagibacter sp.]|jgi:phosphatidate cytidylyltransferase|nr:phosphatidate cytidylyltransferase [Candidatus Pelagibacter sp.]